jgi:hypothetical protein
MIDCGAADMANAATRLAEGEELGSNILQLAFRSTTKRCRGAADVLHVENPALKKIPLVYDLEAFASSGGSGPRP